MTRRTQWRYAQMAVGVATLAGWLYVVGRVCADTIHTTTTTQEVTR